MGKDKRLQLFYTWLPSVVIILIYFSEAIKKYFVFYPTSGFELQKYVKLGLFILFGILLLKKWKDLIGPVLLVIFFLVGQLFTPNGFQNDVLTSGMKIVFPLLLFVYYYRNPMSEGGRELFYRTFEGVLIFNAIFILVGMIAEIYMLKSYMGDRWGFNGLFLTSSGSSYIYAIAIFYALLRYKNRFLLHWKTWLFLISAFLTGTKILYLSIMVSFLVYVFYYLPVSAKRKKLFALLIVVGSILSFYLVFFRFGIFDVLMKEKGLGSALFSFRNDLLTDKTIPFIQDNWSVVNYLFGGINDTHTRSEMGFFDLFYFYGIMGVIFFIMLYNRYFFTFKWNAPLRIIFATLIVVIFLAGNFFESGLLPIFVLLLKEICSSEDVYQNMEV